MSAYFICYNLPNLLEKISCQIVTTHPGVHFMLRCHEGMCKFGIYSIKLVSMYQSLCETPSMGRCLKEGNNQVDIDEVCSQICITYPTFENTKICL